MSDVCIKCHLPFHSSQTPTGFLAEARVSVGGAGPYHAGCAPTFATPDEPMDWADSLAIDIISMVYGRSIGDARRAVAKELRFLRIKSVPRVGIKLVHSGDPDA